MTTLQIKFKEYYKNNPVTTIILILNSAMLVVILAFGGFTIENLVRLGGLVPRLVSENNDYHRLLMSMFLHGSLLHFLFNTYFLYHLGAFIEKLLGKGRYIVIYFVSGLGSGLLVWWLGDPRTVTIGASGALFGIMGALLVLTYVKTTWFTAYTIRSIRSLVVVNLIFTFLVPNISVYGHLGGFVSGIGLVYFMIPKNPLDKDGFRFQKNQNKSSDVIEHEDIEDEDIYVH
ncbi:MAG: rhomboid family intramembrane serine protease [Candidatus Izemoplasmatales bacterium]